MDKILFVDLDSTLWDTEPLYYEGMMRLFGRYIAPDERVDFNWPRALGDNWWDLFDYALHPNKIYKREFYPYAVDALYKIVYMRFGIHFCSHNPNRILLEGPVRLWLEDAFNFDFDLTIFGARNDKIDYMDTHVGGWGIVEDKPSTIRKAVRKGYPTFMRVHNYNLPLLEDSYLADNIYAFEDWKLMPGLVKEALDNATQSVR